LAALAVAGSWSSDARAQAASGTAAIKLDVNSIARRRVNDPPGTNYPYRNARRWWINYEECRNPNEEYFEFPLSVPNPGPPWRSGHEADRIAALFAVTRTELSPAGLSPRMASRRTR